MLALATGITIPAAVEVLAADEAVVAPAEAETPRDGHDPLFLGFESEPAMDLGGRTIASLDAGACRLLGSLARSGRRPAIAAVWEVPLGLLLSVVQHEVSGHGGRAREFGLHPRYGAGLGFSFYTTIRKNPESNEVTTLLAAGGIESDEVLERRLLLDLYRPRGGEGATVPLLLMAKLDLTLYAFQATKPEGPDRPGRDDDFSDQFEEGNDVVIYLVGRQAQRAGADPTEVWERDYAIDFSDRLLLDTWRDVRATALWNFLDPAVAFTVVAYANDHLGDGAVRIRPLVVELSRGVGLTAGTRGFLGPAEVSRFLDLYLATPAGLGTVYARDLDSTIDKTYGYGVGLHRVRIVEGFEVGAQSDFWREPEALERSSRGSSWNASVEVDLLFRSRWGFALKAGAKSEGFFPGTPMERGGYIGFGARAAF